MLLGGEELCLACSHICGTFSCFLQIIFYIKTGVTNLDIKLHEGYGLFVTGLRLLEVPSQQIFGYTLVTVCNSS